MFIRNLRLMFNDTVDGQGGGGSDPVVDQQVQQPEPTDGVNPAWGDIQALVDPETFSRIQPKLQEWDKGVQTRFTSLAEKYKPYESLLNGRQPEYLQQAVAYADMLDRAPEEVFARLHGYLKTRGFTPEQIQGLIGDGPDQGQQPQGQQPQVPGQQQEDSSPLDPRIQQLAEQQQMLLQQMQEARRQEQLREAQVALDNEVRALREAHKELDDEDVREIIARAALAAQRTQGTPGARVPTLEEAYQEYNALATRIQSRQRPGDSAPTLVPPAGGGVGGQQQKSWGSLPKDQMVDAVAAMLNAGKS